MPIAIETHVTPVYPTMTSSWTAVFIGPLLFISYTTEVSDAYDRHGGSQFADSSVSSAVYEEDVAVFSLILIKLN